MASGCQTNEVDTFGPLGRFSVRLPHPCKAGRMKMAVGEKLGLKPASLPLFALFEGPLGAPTSVLSEEHNVSPSSKLCFQRWNADLALETKLCRHDDAATGLLYAEAQFNVERGTITTSSEEVREELASLSDPTFPAERQFLELAQTLPGYQAHVARGVVMEGDMVSKLQIPAGTLLTCCIEPEQISLKVGNEGDCVSWQWQLVKRWRTLSARQLHYEVCTMQANAPILSWIHLTTPQAYYLRAVSELFCHSLYSGQHHAPGPPAPNPRLAGKPINPLIEFLNSELFRFNKFSSVEK